MRRPPMSDGFWANAMFTPLPYLALIWADNSPCKSWGSGVALSTRTLRRSRSSFTSRCKRARISRKPRGFFSEINLSACRTRFSSSKPFTWQLRNSSRASRIACFDIFMARLARWTSLRGQFLFCLLGQATLVFRREDLPGHGGRGLDDQSANFLLQLREHLHAFLRGGFARLGDNLFGGSDGLLSFLLTHAGGS